jgi:hypothetical protein
VADRLIQRNALGQENATGLSSWRRPGNWDCPQHPVNLVQRRYQSAEFQAFFNAKPVRAGYRLPDRFGK